MPLVIRSLVPYSTTIDGVTVGPFKSVVTAAGAPGSGLTAAVAAGTHRYDIMNDSDAAEAAKETVQVATPLTGETVAVEDGTEVMVVNPAGTIAALTLTMPANPYDGQEVVLATTQVVTALTQTAAGKTIKAPLTAATANGFGRWRYRTADTTWYRVG